MQIRHRALLVSDARLPVFALLALLESPAIERRLQGIPVSRRLCCAIDFERFVDLLKKIAARAR